MKIELSEETVKALTKDIEFLNALATRASNRLRENGNTDEAEKLGGYRLMQWPAARELMVAISDASKPQEVKGVKIKTRTLAPTDTEGAQIKAWSEDGRIIVVPWDYGVDDMHRHAAETLNDDKPVRFLWNTPGGCEYTTDRGIGRY